MFLFGPSNNSSLLPSENRRRRLRLVRTVVRHLTDYVILCGIILFSYNLDHFTPAKRPFSLTDVSISFPFTEDTMISTNLLILISTAIPAAIILVVGLGSYPSKSWAQRFAVIHTGVLGLVMGIGLAMLFTDGLKNLIGKPRPDFLARCKPDLQLVPDNIVGFHSEGETSIERVLVDIAVCTQSNRDILREGLRSFPSGHSSISFSGLTYLSLVLASRLSIFHIPIRTRRLVSQFDPARPNDLAVSTLGVWRVFIAILPLCGAFFVASTRVSDFRHHYNDVIFGAVEGILTALFAYRFYFPGWSELQHETALTEGQPSQPARNNITAPTSFHIDIRRTKSEPYDNRDSVPTVIIGRDRDDVELGELRGNAGTPYTIDRSSSASEKPLYNYGNRI